MLIDCTIGFNEIDLFELRIAELEDVVDTFVVVEATHTHSGQPKPLYFTEWYKDNPRHNVIIHVWDNANMHDPWQRENYQRETIGYVLKSLSVSRDTIIMLSDMDEIPKASSLHNFIYEYWDNASDGVNQTITDGVYRFEQDLSYGHFNTTEGKWNGTKIFRYDQIDWNVEKVLTDFVRYRPEHMIAGTIKDGGWHFSSCGGTDKVRYKFDSYAHTEMALKSNEDIQDSLDNALQPFSKQPLTVQSIDFLPEHVKRNLDTYRKYIYNG